MTAKIDPREFNVHADAVDHANDGSVAGPDDSKGVFDEFEYEEKEQSFLELVSSQLHGAIVSAIPSDQIQNLHPHYFYPIAGVIGILLAGAFLASFLPGYLQGESYRYLSPAENSNSYYCNPIPLSITGTFYGAPTGYWEGSEGFSYADATYLIKVTNYQSTPALFNINMHRIDWALKYYGKVGKMFDLSFNLLIWSSMVLIDGKNNNQKFHMAGSPIKIFDRQVISGRMSSVDGECTVPAKTTFDTATGLLQISYSYTAFTADPVCAASATPAHLGYSAASNADDFNVKFDVRTLVTALAVNMHMLNLTSLQPIRTNYAQRIAGQPVRAYIDPRYPGMQPITCAIVQSIPVCTVLMASTFGIPIFNHIGRSLIQPELCSCSNFTTTYTDADRTQCNAFNFMLGVLYYDTTDANDLLLLFQKSLSLKYPGMLGINGYSHGPTFLASSAGMTSPARPVFASDTGLRQLLYDFCHTATGRYCKYLTFSLHDDQNPTHTVTDFFYQLTDGACRDSYSAFASNWGNLTAIPFTKLTQDYEVCRSDMQTVFLNQLGNTVGNMGVFAPIIIFLVLAALLVFQKCTGIKLPTKYGAEEKKDILDQLAITLLLIREGKLKPSRLINATNKRQMTQSASGSGHQHYRRNGLSPREPRSSPRTSGEVDNQSTGEGSVGDVGSTMENLAMELKSLEKMKLHKMTKLPTAGSTSSQQPSRGLSMILSAPSNAVDQNFTSMSGTKPPPAGRPGFAGELSTIPDHDEERGSQVGENNKSNVSLPPYNFPPNSAPVESYSPQSILSEEQLDP